MNQLIYNICTVWLVLCYVGTQVTCITNTDDGYTEQLYIRPLPDGIHTLYQFTFISIESINFTTTISHYKIIPKSIQQIVQQHRINEYTLSLTNGVWDNDKWSNTLTSTDTVLHNITNIIFPYPSLYGTELYSDTHTHQQFTDLQHSLSTLYCSSLSSARPSDTPIYHYNNKSYYYSSLSTDSICTENLTPFILLLPCKFTSGIATILKSYNLFDTVYHSLISRYIYNKYTAETQFIQSFTVVLSNQYNVPQSILNIFHLNKPFNICRVSKHNQIILHNSHQYQHINSVQPSINTTTIHTGSDVHNIQMIDFDSNLANIMFTHTHSNNTTQSKYNATYFHYSNYLTENGGLHGTINYEFTNLHQYSSVYVTFQHQLAHYLLFYHSSLQCTTNNTIHQCNTIIDDLSYNDNILRYTMILPSESTMLVSLQYEKYLLQITEFPADVSRGFDLPNVHISTVLINSSTDIQSINQQLLTRYITSGILIRLPFPDFSMPFNVIAFTSTVIAFCFGSLFRVLYESDQQILHDKQETKLIKLIRRLNQLIMKIKNIIINSRQRNKIKSQ